MSTDANLHAHAARAVRIAGAVVGEAGAAAGVARRVIARGAIVAGELDDPALARWFDHHIILACREIELPQDERVLRLAVQRGHPADYVAFVRALRQLPRQQIEAFVLHHGEAMTDRQMAIAMDCSTTAAATHLSAAGRALGAVVGQSLQQQIDRWKQNYHRLDPGGAVSMPMVQRATTARRRRSALRWLWRALMLATLMALIAAGWWLISRVQT